MHLPLITSATRGAFLVMLASSLLTGCYIVPVRAPDGSVRYEHHPLPPAGAIMAAPVGRATTPAPATIPVRLYPANDQATPTGIINGTVTNMMTGKGRFIVNYQGDVLNGEATRVSNDERRGVASAFGSGGMYMSCEYQMNTPMQGAGTCLFSNGARYQLHVGN